ncbi:phosphopeptide-binding protein [Neolewinella antarctica]|uniref:Phosphopeptide-binding protein n=1 Tax=Neolewinella antarctica TaxID=442734 RepID=A0ABX0XD33_9BACT|nr:phosphopeptide-binding protein [Neolewinella antarctica]NJC26841.1 hypothetical protein [Neolewinella antarctica]
MKITNLLFLALFTLAISACGNRTSPMDNVAENEAKLNENDELGASNSGTIQLTPMPPTEEFQDAAITEWTYTKGNFDYNTTGYTFGKQTDDAEQIMCANSDKGQHAHLILNNEPYIAKYTPEFEQEIPDGNHYILTFLSRSYHESIKTPAAHRAVRTDVSAGSFSGTTDITEPMLFYSRPKGTYTGEKETENVMLDFYPVNAELSEDGYHVKAVVNGTEEFDVTEWRPYFLTGLPMGENEVTLTLVKDGEVVDAPLNPVTRTFTLRANPTEEGK